MRPGSASTARRQRNVRSMIPIAAKPSAALTTIVVIFIPTLKVQKFALRDSGIERAWDRLGPVGG